LEQSEICGVESSEGLAEKALHGRKAE
jgi:hypothetical protein